VGEVAKRISRRKRVFARKNLARKLALCERAEALSGSTNWIQTADEIKKLQAEWKNHRPVSRGQEKTIWERFRGACDTFFTRRHADLAERKTVWTANLARKEALIARVEALAESTDWEATANEIKRIQNEWKAIGPVKKSRSEALWQKFRRLRHVLCPLCLASRHRPGRTGDRARSDRRRTRVAGRRRLGRTSR
jgi:phage repressor protein C with HTH and peptisase S24 domain